MSKLRINKKNVKLNIREDRAILMICIGIALIFWLLVKLSQQYSTERPLIFDFSVPDDKTFSQAPPEDITVSIRGTGWDLMFDYFSHSEITLSYDLQQDDQLNLSSSRISNAIEQQLPDRKISVVNVDVDNISLRLEPKVEKKVPVKLKGAFSFAPEYHLRSPVTLTPDSILITGPASLVNDITQWPTDSLILKELKSSQVLAVSLQLPPRELSVSKNEVELNIEIEPYTEKSLFVTLELLNEPPNDSLRYFPQRVKVTCVVGLSQYDQVKAEDFRLVADLMGTPIGNERNRVPIEIKERPPFVKSINFTPKTAEYFIVQKEEDLPQ